MEQEEKCDKVETVKEIAYLGDRVIKVEDVMLL